DHPQPDRSQSRKPARATILITTSVHAPCSSLQRTPVLSRLGTLSQAEPAVAPSLARGGRPRSGTGAGRFVRRAQLDQDPRSPGAPGEPPDVPAVVRRPMLERFTVGLHTLKVRT